MALDMALDMNLDMTLDMALDMNLRLLRTMITTTSTMPQPTASEMRMECSHVRSMNQLCPKWARV